MTLCIHYTLNFAGGRVVHSYGRLIPHEFPITDLRQISGPDNYTIGGMNCTDSSKKARFNDYISGEEEGVMMATNGATATLKVGPLISHVSSFQNRDLYCTNASTNYFYLFISSASKYTSCITCTQLNRYICTHTMYNFTAQRSLQGCTSLEVWMATK